MINQQRAYHHKENVLGAHRQSAHQENELARRPVSFGEVTQGDKDHVSVSCIDSSWHVVIPATLEQPKCALLLPSDAADSFYTCDLQQLVMQLLDRQLLRNLVRAVACGTVSVYLGWSESDLVVKQQLLHRGAVVRAARQHLLDRR